MFPWISCGFLYLRHSKAWPEFELPAEFLDWKPTCHCGAELLKLWTTMLNRSKEQPGQLFNIWGHSYEFEDDLGWKTIEAFAALAVGTPGVWHATKGEIYDYVSAWRRLDWSLDGTLVRNPSVTPVWFCRSGEISKIEGGQILHLKE